MPGISLLFYELYISFPLWNPIMTNPVRVDKTPVILVVDDDRLMQAMLQDALSAAGFETVLAG